MKKLFFLSCLVILLSFYIIPINQALAGEETDQLAPRAVAGVCIPGHFTKPDYWDYDYWDKGKGYMIINTGSLFAEIDFAKATEKNIAVFNEISKKLKFPYQVIYNWDGTLYLKPR